MTIDLSDNCKTEFSKTDDCNDSQSKSEDQDICHCTFSCSPKILAFLVYSLSAPSFSSTQDFPQYVKVFKNLDPLPILQPPIA